MQAASTIGCILLTYSTSRLSTGQLLARHCLRNMQCFDQVPKSRPCLARVQKQCSRPRLAQVPEGWRRCKQTSAMQIWRAQSRAESADRIKPGKKKFRSTSSNAGKEEAQYRDRCALIWSKASLSREADTRQIIAACGKANSHESMSSYISVYRSGFSGALFALLPHVSRSICPTALLYRASA